MNEKDPLDHVLKNWKVAPPAQTDFQGSVWHRIATSEHPELDFQRTSHPVWQAVAACAAAIVAGFLIGTVTPAESDSSAAHALHLDHPQTLYFAKINPLVPH